jgi:anthranilate synthase component 1
MQYPDWETFRKLANQGNLIPVYREILADTITPVSALLNLGSELYVYLLESVEGGKNGGATRSWGPPRGSSSGSGGRR